MRLSKLAIELSKTQTELLDFFEKRSIREYKGANSKISKEHIELIYKKYKPDLLKPVVEEEDGKGDYEIKSAGTLEESIGDTSGITELQTEVDVEIKKEDISQEEPEIDQTGPDSFEITAKVDDIEVIRAPKIKLEGVKVVGKIDLPEITKPKREKKESGQEEMSIEKKIARKVLFADHSKSRRETAHDNKKDRIKPNVISQKNIRNKSELTYEEKLKRQENRLKREIEKQDKVRKEQKKKHYIQHVQSKIQPKKKNSLKKSALDKPKLERPVYNSTFQKFWAWLHNEHDKYD